MERTIVVSVPRHTARVHDRPIGHVLEQEVGVVLQIGRGNERSGETKAIWVGTRAIPRLYGIPAPEGDEAATVEHLAANIEIRIHDEHRCPEIACPDGRVKSRAPRPANNDIRFVVPSNALGQCRIWL
jgi:hypothetical protein